MMSQNPTKFGAIAKARAVHFNIRQMKTRLSYCSKNDTEVHCAFVLIFMCITKDSLCLFYFLITGLSIQKPPQTRCLPQLSIWLGCCRELALTGTPLPPGVCLPKSAKAGVKSGPRGKMRGSRVRIGNLGWLICTHEEAQKSLKHTCPCAFSARKFPQNNDAVTTRKDVSGYPQGWLG